MHADRPIVVTGAAGFLGRRLVDRLRADHPVVAIDRMPQSDGDVTEHPDVRRYQIDLADADAVAEVFGELERSGGAHALVHLAAYYDFTGEGHPEYHRTNVEATRFVLEHAVGLRPRRFVFASSVAACPFSSPGHPITEETPPAGRHVYAVTKRAGEEMLREFAHHFPTCSIRFAALYSDWCEYPPLYFFLETWLSDRWNARVLGGRGDSAVPFLHVREATGFVTRVLQRTEALDRHEVLIASTDGAVSHRQLYEASTSYYFGEIRRPWHVPRPLCGPGMWVRDVVGRALGDRPFERPWMAAYVDRTMEVDASRSREKLRWSPRGRLAILERIPFMIEHLRADPVEWYARNREALEHRSLSPRYRIYRLLQKHETEIGEAFFELLRRREGERALSSYRDLSDDELHRSLRLSLGSLVESVRSGSEGPFMTYYRDLARRRLEQGFLAAEIIHSLRSLERLCIETVLADPDGGGLERELRNHVAATIEFGIDGVLDIYEGS